MCFMEATYSNVEGWRQEDREEGGAAVCATHWNFNHNNNTQVLC